MIKSPITWKVGWNGFPYLKKINVDFSAYREI